MSRNNDEHIPSKVLNRKLNLIILLLLMLLGLAVAQLTGLL